MGYANISSVCHGTTAQAVANIFDLHFPGTPTIADLTWGRGRFWTKLPAVAPNVIGFDIDTRGGSQIRSAYQHVPLRDQSVDVAVFDPPFIFSPGLRGIVGAKRFFLGSPEGVKERFYEGPRSDKRIIAPRNKDDLLDQTIRTMVEMKRIARLGMILKGQNLITDQHPNWWTYDVMKYAELLFHIRPEDELIQISPAARLVDPRWNTQYHFRRAHCYYLVYKW